jgi:hypothetical protein
VVLFALNTKLLLHSSKPFLHPFYTTMFYGFDAAFSGAGAPMVVIPSGVVNVAPRCQCRLNGQQCDMAGALVGSDGKSYCSHDHMFHAMGLVRSQTGNNNNGGYNNNNGGYNSNNNNGGYNSNNNNGGYNSNNNGGYNSNNNNGGYNSNNNGGYNSNNNNGGYNSNNNGGYNSNNNGGYNSNNNNGGYGNQGNNGGYGSYQGNRANVNVQVGVQIMQQSSRHVACTPGGTCGVNGCTSTGLPAFNGCCGFNHQSIRDQRAAAHAMGHYVNPYAAR